MRCTIQQAEDVRLPVVEQMAKANGWERTDWQAIIGMVSYKKENKRINIYLTRMSVATCLHHPTKGETQLFRKNVSMELLEKLFRNPRQHTGKGYYEK